MEKEESMEWPIAGCIIRMNAAIDIRRGAADMEAFRLAKSVIDTDLFWPRGRKIWRFGGRIRMQVGEPFVLERGVGTDGRKEPLEDVTTRLMLRIAALLPPRHQGVYGPLLAADGVPTGVLRGSVR